LLIVHSNQIPNTFGTKKHFIRMYRAFHSNEMTFSFGCFLRAEEIRLLFPIILDAKE